jgi:hypothetical protein
LTVDLASVGFAFPNTCVPIAAISQHYKAMGLSISTTDMPSRVESTGVFHPFEATPQALADPHRVMNRVWVYFDTNEATCLTDAIVRHLETAIPMERGVQESLNLCLYEIVDNVFEHSEQSSGYFMATMMTSTKRLAVAIGDAGIGALNSFKNSGHHPHDDFDALTLAVQAGVTSTGDAPRGNGLYTLQRTVEVNNGRLELRSGTGQLLITERGPTGGDFASQPMISRDLRGFFVDWQLDLSTPVRMEDVYADLPAVPVNHLLEAIENDYDEYVVAIRHHDAGLGTRKAATELRNSLQNKLSLGAPKLVLDFEGVAVVSASFADEVIGKLAEQYGVIGFMRTFELRNMTPTVEQLLNRAISRRVATSSQEAITSDTVRTDLRPPRRKGRRGQRDTEDG